MNSVRVLLASDLSLPRAGLRLILESIPGFTIVGEVVRAAAAAEQIGVIQPDVVVMSVSSRAGFGTLLIEELVRVHRTVRIVALSVRNESSYIRLLISAGARGYVCEQSPPIELFQAIQEAAQDRIYIDSQVETLVGHESLGDVKVDAAAGAPKRPAFLSRREADVLRLLARGFSNQQVADNLLLSVKTAETYRTRLTRKLGVKNRADLFRMAYEVGMIDLSDLSDLTASGKTI